MGTFVHVSCVPPGGLPTQTTPKTPLWLGAVYLSFTFLLWLFILGVHHLGFAVQPRDVSMISARSDPPDPTSCNGLRHWHHTFHRCEVTFLFPTAGDWPSWALILGVCL